MFDRQEESHPAYGVVKAHLCEGGNVELFGSKVFHSRYVEVEVLNATLIVDGQHERAYSANRDMIVRFTLSETQWGQFVSGIGRGEGTPVTLTRLGKESLPRVTGQVSNRQRHEAAFAQTCKKAVEGIDAILLEAADLAVSGKANKRQLVELAEKLKNFRRLVPSNLDYVLKTFEQETEKIVQEAKRAVEDHIRFAPAPAIEERNPTQ